MVAPRSWRKSLVPTLVAGGLGLATSGSTTGLPVADRLLRSGLAASMAAASITAPPSILIVLGTVAAALGWTAGPLAACAGLAALGLAAAVALAARFDHPVTKAAVGGLASVTLLRLPGSELRNTFLVLALAAVVVVAGIRGASSRPRSPARIVGLGVLGLFGVAALLGAVAGFTARRPLERSTTKVGLAIRAIRAGDTPGAAASAASAAADLRRGEATLTSWWARPAWAVPVLGAHLRAVAEVTQTAAPAIESATQSVGALDLDNLRPESGRLDLARLRATEPDLQALSAALHSAQRVSGRVRSPWLVAPLRRRLDRYGADLQSLTATTDRALLAVQTVPNLLGAERPTRWFVAVANPAEARELGGFIGDYAIVTATEGSLRLERSGGVREIGASEPGRNLTNLDLPARYLSQKPELYWQNLSGYPDFPTVAEAARTLWAQVAPTSPIDGVIYVDPHGLAGLLRLTGPVSAPEPLGRLTSGNIAKLLFEDQYARFTVQNERKDALQQATESIFIALTDSPWPGPAQIGSALQPVVQGGHLLLTSFDPANQRFLDEIGLSGRFPTSDGGDLASLRTSNLGENKLDTYLQRSVDYRVVVDPNRGRVNATATIQLANQSSSTLPDYAAGNQRNLPKATNMVEVAWYSGLRLQEVLVDGKPVTARSFFERGWWTHSLAVTLAPGQAAVVTFRLEDALPATQPYRLATAPQAAVKNDNYEVNVTAVAGWKTGEMPALVQGRRNDFVIAFTPMRPTA